MSRKSSDGSLSRSDAASDKRRAANGGAADAHRERFRNGSEGLYGERKRGKGILKKLTRLKTWSRNFCFLFSLLGRLCVEVDVGRM